jgi:predicted dehydrogenase
MVLGIYNFCVQAEFGFNIEADRLNKKELGGGACLDIGIYCIQLAQFVFNGEKPNKVCATFKLDSGLKSRFSLK